MKRCTLCGLEKTLNSFPLKRNYHDGMSPWCRECKSKKDKEQYQLNKEKRKQKASEYYEQNKDKVLERRRKDPRVKEYNKKWKEENKDIIRQYNFQYRELNIDTISSQRAQYRKENREKINAYSRNKTKEDPIFKLSKKLRGRLRDFLLSGDKKWERKSSYDYLGCTLSEFKEWIEKQFTSEMTWENHGTVWHLDHKLPLAAAKNSTQLYYLAHYTNIQPLLSKDNFKKNDKIPENICWQKLQRDIILPDDIKKGMPTGIKAKEFVLAREQLNSEHRRFIERYEWLGSCGFGVRHVFTARYNGILGGVVMIAEPNGYQFKKEQEALIQRGACASWTPKNLGSRLVMFACRWMRDNTSKRIFTAYSDPEAGEIGTIYQACNFDYLGDGYGSEYQYKISNGKLVGDRYFTRTSSMKKWAKELGIIWENSWSKPNGFQNIKAIPSDIYKKLRNYAKNEQNKYPKVKRTSKGKYVLLLPKKGEIIEKTWSPKPYPKRNIN